MSAAFSKESLASTVASVTNGDALVTEGLEAFAKALAWSMRDPSFRHDRVAATCAILELMKPFVEYVPRMELEIDLFKQAAATLARVETPLEKQFVSALVQFGFDCEIQAMVGGTKTGYRSGFNALSFLDQAVELRKAIREGREAELPSGVTTEVAILAYVCAMQGNPFTLQGEINQVADEILVAAAAEPVDDSVTFRWDRAAAK